MPQQLDPIDRLPAFAASDVKKRGWRGVTRALEKGALVITNHDEPEAVVVPVEQYERLVEIARHEASRMQASLDALRRRFDERLAVLRAPDAGDRLRAAARQRTRLHGKVKAGATY